MTVTHDASSTDTPTNHHRSVGDDLDDPQDRLNPSSSAPSVSEELGREKWAELLGCCFTCLSQNVHLQKQRLPVLADDKFILPSTTLVFN